MAGRGAEWARVVQDLAADRELRYEPVGGLNPRDAPAALCPGGRNRLTGMLAEGFWGASCDADEREVGGLFKKAVVPASVLVKAHMPDLTRVVPAFNVESIEARPEEYLKRASRRRVEFESIDFNRRFVATVPSEHDPIAVRELFSPAFLEWAVGIERECDFGASEGQLYFLWRLDERSQPELELALEGAGELFRRVRRELEEEGMRPYPAGPWNAGMERFPDRPGEAPQTASS